MKEEFKNKKKRKQALKFYIFDEDLIVKNSREVNLTIKSHFTKKPRKCKQYKPENLSFKVNEYITLKLESMSTYIYIKENRFIQCIRLLLELPKTDLEKYIQVNSIDDAVDIYEHSIYQNRIVEGSEARPVRRTNFSISREEEFRGHCSNIQAWAENNYNTCILHSNIAFPLLKELTKAGDPLAKKVFKDEIAKRFVAGNYTVRKFLQVQGYLKYLSKEELSTVLQTLNDTISTKENFFNKNYKENETIGIIENLVLYYLILNALFGEERSRNFLKCCQKNLFIAFNASLKKEKKQLTYQEIKNITIKRKKLHRELLNVKKSNLITPDLEIFLQTLEISIRFLDPESVEYAIKSLRATS